jgi:tetratricopeptide (TPR) repeat protein/anti-sigma regulatory factor (Ser/Thr protein kinase)
MKFTSQLLPFFLFIFFLVSIPVSGQKKCECIEYTKMLDDEGAIALNQSALSKSSNIYCQAKAAEWQANTLFSQQKFDSSEFFLKKAEKLFNESSCGDSSLLETYKLWAQIYYSKADFAKSQVYTFKLLKAAEASGNFYEIANCHTMIAQIFNQTEQADKGIAYTRIAVSLLKKINNPEKKLDILFKISKRYLWHYQDTKTASSLDSSELFSKEQLKLAGTTRNEESTAKAFSHQQGIAWEKGDLPTALSLLDSSFKYTPRNQYDNLGTNYYDKADILIELKQYAKAKEMADSSLSYRKRNGNPTYIAELYELIYARIGEATGNYKMAYEYKEQSRAITDSINKADQATEIAELEKKYSQEKNENTIKSLAQQKRIYILLAIAGLLALIGLTFFIRQQSLKNKQRILETEQRLNRARMNPHFFFNALSSLQSYALDGNDGKSIASNLSKFSHIMRETLESTYKEYVTIEQESDFLREYLELQKIRFPQKFSYTINIASAIEPDDTLLPAMILQPFAENSIEHGFTGINYPGELTITFDKKEKDLHISIVDNGKGLVNTAKETSEHISRASQIIKDRIYLLNVKLKTKAAFTIDNNKNEKGVTVLIRLPLLYKQDKVV